MSDLDNLMKVFGVVGIALRVYVYSSIGDLYVASNTALGTELFGIFCGLCGGNELGGFS